MDVADRLAIAELLARYCACADANDPDGLAACFTADCLCDYGPPGTPPEPGREARRAAAARDLALFAATSHHLSNVVIEPDGADRARVRSTVYAWHRPLAGDATWHLHAEYHDVVVRTAAGWLLAERRLLVAGAEGFPPDWRFLPLPRAG